MFVIWHLTIWKILDIHEASHQDEAIGPALGGWALCSASVKLIAGIRWVVDVLVLCEATWKGTKRWLFDDDDDDDDDYDFLLFGDILYKIPLKGRKRGTLLHPQVSYIHDGFPSACVYPVVERSDKLPIASSWFPTFPNQIFSMCFSVLVSS